MATFRLRRFSSPETLKAIAPERLVAFLDPYRDYFASRGVELPPANRPQAIDYQGLVITFMSPDEETPRDLIDSLFLVDEMSTPEDMDVLLDAMSPSLDFDEKSKPTPADVAVQVWLLDRDVLERKHAERFLYRPRSFEYYQANGSKPDEFSIPSTAVQAAMQEEMDNWFEKKNRGRGSRVFVCPREDEIWFLVRHGEPFKREESMEASETSSVCYRPLKYDVVVYRSDIRELRINARSKGEKQLYRQQFGKHIFGDEEFFPGRNKYTLEPLREYGADGLSCFGIEGMEWVKLTEIHYFWGGEHGEVEIRKADDIFAALEARGRTIPERCRILQAKFQIKFADSKTPRSLKIRGSNIAEYTRDSDASLIEEWLTKRGFTVVEESEIDEALEEVLVVA